jgi:hypothetical protein
VVNPQKRPFKSYEDFYAYARANPGKLNFASAGNGTAHQLTVELYKTLTQTYMTHSRIAVPDLPCRTCSPVRSISCSMVWAVRCHTSRPES